MWLDQFSSLFTFTPRYLYLETTSTHVPFMVTEDGLDPINLISVLNTVLMSNKVWVKVFFFIRGLY